MKAFFTIFGTLGIILMVIMLTIVAGGFIRGFYLRRKLQKEIKNKLKGEEEHGSSSDGVH